MSYNWKRLAQSWYREWFVSSLVKVHQNSRRSLKSYQGKERYKLFIQRSYFQTKWVKVLNFKIDRRSWEKQKSQMKHRWGVVWVVRTTKLNGYWNFNSEERFRALKETYRWLKKEN